MPSETAADTRVTEALGPSRDVFRSTVVTFLEELRGMLADAAGSDRDRARALAAELGPFAAGRVDPERLARVLGPGRPLGADAVSVVERALEVVAAAAQDGAGKRSVEVVVPSGADLRDAVRDALVRAGRVFGAARAADLARTGNFRPREHDDLFEGLPLRSWTRRELQVAPPLVARVSAADLRPAGLADFLEGNQKIVLLVEGTPAPPAATARLLTPGVMVIQTDDPTALDALGHYPGPGLAAVFQPGADVVHFVHDPRGGSLPWERISLSAEPDEIRRGFAGQRWREPSWSSDLEHLLALAAAPAGADVGLAQQAAGEPPATSADRLAAWLLARSDLDERG
ncbi:MAG TPA: hypothetical protein VK837_08700 [Longimicrobiales bacterium]|nr:hypothetical protein [Longimicrobiales bacterium]